MKEMRMANPMFRSNWSNAIQQGVNTYYELGNSTINAAAWGVFGHPMYAGCYVCNSSWWCRLTMLACCSQFCTGLSLHALDTTFCAYGAYKLTAAAAAEALALEFS